MSSHGAHRQPRFQISTLVPILLAMNSTINAVRFLSTHAPADDCSFDWAAGIHTVPSTATPSAQKSIRSPNHREIFRKTGFTNASTRPRIDWLNDAGKESVTVLLNSSATVPPWRSRRTATNHAAPEVVFLEDLSRRGYGQNRRRKRHGKFWGGQILTVSI